MFPLLILVGRDDQRTLARACEEMARPPSAAGNPIEVQVYPGVKNGFADPYWGTTKEILGFPAAYDPTAAEDSLYRARAFLDHHVSGKSH